MSVAPSPKASSRRSRKSMGNLPTSDAFDRENNTIHGLTGTSSSSKAAGKKSRSKSIGPGGLEALNETSGNKQKALPIIKSILKPTISLSPPKPIPLFPNLRKSSPGKGGSPRGKDVRQSGVDNLPNPFEDSSSQNAVEKDSTRVAVRTEEEQQAAARERERKEAIDRRDARRKSLANRRVSFAPEATLHTWDVVEIPDDATTSSEATNSTRRASSGSSLPASPFPNRSTDLSSDPPSTPPKEEIQVAASPAQQRELHKKQRRRSSGIPPMNFNNPNDFSSSPTSSITDDETQQSFMTAEGDIIDGSDSDEDEDRDLVTEEGTEMEIDNDNTTNHSIASNKSMDTSSTGSSAQLNDALRQAAKQANTHGIEYDEHGDLPMDIADDEVTNAFKPLVQQQQQTASKPTITRNMSSLKDQENVNPFSPAFKANLDAQDEEADDDEDMTMDVTQAVGGIITGRKSPQKRNRRKSVAVSRRRSSVARRRSSGDSMMEDETMDITMAIGGIQSASSQPQTESMEDDGLDENEELTMEFTNVVGGFLNPNRSNGVESQPPTQEENILPSPTQIGMDMEMTMAVGRIMSPVLEQTEPLEDETFGMDITTAVGSILPKDLKTNDKATAKMLMEEEADHGQLTHSPFKQLSQEVIKETPIAQRSVAASETGSPVVTAQSRATRRSAGARLSATPKATSRQTTPVKKPTTPSKQLTPQPTRPPTSPSKTPPAKNVAMRRNSPKRLFKPESNKTQTPPAKPTLQFHEDLTTGLSMPSIILTPRPRLPTGVGADQSGLGSPRVTEILNRRTSIGEQAAKFSPQGKVGGVRFADPRELELEIDNERAEEQRRESGRGILQMEAEGTQEEDKDVTGNLRDMIQSMTPKKNKLKGRKSLAVGGAKGLLGKRPAELDDEDEDATPKRLKGQNRSPVKNVRLPAPPSKIETTGRRTRSRVSLGDTTDNITTPITQESQNEAASTPKGQGRFKDTEVVKSASKPPVSFNEHLAGVPEDSATTEEEDERIHLQDFLNMTSIRFMELTTTKRRHTVAPGAALESGLGSGPGGLENDRALSSCVVAGACTIPMLELYQHSCRELKKYISEGRSIVREIETDTFEENPALFREYLSASPDIRAIMDNQFKNVKTHARLLSKAMWYEWRMKLLEGLREGLVRIDDGFVNDDEILAEQERLLGPVVPQLVEKHQKLSEEAVLLQSQADELANCDQEELSAAREKLVAAEEEIETKRKMVEELRAQLKQQEQGIENVVERKAECLKETEEAERVREEYRGWSSAEVAALKANVDELQKSTGWTITSAQGQSILLTYRSSVSLFLTPSAFAPHASANSQNESISLSYASQNDSPPTTHRFFLQYLRARLFSLTQCQTRIRDVMTLVSNGWDLATTISQNVESLSLSYMTEPAIAGDDVLSVRSTILLRAMETKVEVLFQMGVGGSQFEVQSEVEAKARVVYGENLKEGRMGEFLMQRIDTEATRKVGDWADAVRDLEARLIARGKKSA